MGCKESNLTGKNNVRKNIIFFNYKDFSMKNIYKTNPMIPNSHQAKMEESQMDFAGKIIRKSIHTFLKHFQYLSTIPILLFLPFSSSLLLSQSLFHDSKSLSPFLFPIPFAAFSFLIAKLYIIQSLNHHKPSFPFPPLFSISISTLKSLLFPHICSLLLLIAITATTFFIFSNPLKPVHVSLYCFLANAFFVTNMALVIAGVDGCSGYEAIQKSFLIRRSKGLIVVMLFFPTHMGLASIQALFWHRVRRVWSISASVVFEGLLIACLFSLLIVLDTIVCCFFYKSCKSASTDNVIFQERKHVEEGEFSC